MSEIGNIYVFDSTNIPATSVEINHIPGARTLENECLGFYDEELKADIEKRVASYTPESGQFDGNLLCFNGFEARGGTRTLDLCDMNYSTYQALKARLEREPGQEHRLTKAVTLIALVETSDCHLVLGHRNTNHMPGRYLPPAGFTDHTGSIDNSFFSNLSAQEIAEETGVTVNPIKVRYIGLTSGDDSRNTTLITYTQLPTDTKETEQAFAEVNERLRSNGDQIEHTHLIYLPSDLTSMAHFLHERYTGTLNSIQGIEFTEGICTRGPPEILDKPYKQIGNGISAFLSLIGSTSPGISEYLDFISELDKSDIVDRVEHRDINLKLV